MKNPIFIIEGFPEWKSAVLREETEIWRKGLDNLGVKYYIIEKDRTGKYQMINPKWFVEDFHPDNRFGDLAVEAKNQGCDVYVEKYIPMEGMDLSFIDKDDCVLTQTSINFALQIKKQTNWNPGPWLTVENYECVHYYPILQNANIPLFNGTCLFDTRINVEKGIGKYVEAIGEPSTGRIFIRPSSGIKPFTGMVFIAKEPYFSSDWFWVREGTKEEDILLMARPVGNEDRIVAEWRFIAAEGEILTGSQYKKESESDYSSSFEQQALELAKETAKVYQPDPMYTVDICKNAKDEFSVMELNSFSCAGLYGCDLKPVVTRAIEIARKQYGNR
jgi:hypothetical protein